MHPPSPSTTQVAPPPSPDLIDSFEYTTEMENNVRLIEEADEGRRQNNLPPLFLQDGVPISDDIPYEQDEKTWVVFHGRVPGVYPHL